MLLAKFAELSKADANSLRVSNAPGAPLIKSLILFFTKAVVAILVELLLFVCVVAVAFPVKLD